VLQRCGRWQNSNFVVKFGIQMLLLCGACLLTAHVPCPVPQISVLSICCLPPLERKHDASWGRRMVVQGLGGVPMRLTGGRGCADATRPGKRVRGAGGKHSHAELSASGSISQLPERGTGTDTDTDTDTGSGTASDTDTDTDEEADAKRHRTIIGSPTESEGDDDTHTDSQDDEDADSSSSLRDDASHGQQKCPAGSLCSTGAHCAFELVRKNPQITAFLYIYTHAHTKACVHMCTHACSYMYTCLYTHRHVCTCALTRVHTCMHVCIHGFMCTHVYTGRAEGPTSPATRTDCLESMSYVSGAWKTR